MNEIQAALLALLPPKRKSTPSGWTSFDAVCCQHRGESKDDRKRGGILTGPDGGFQYHCFNCNFKAGWTPGKLLSNNTKQLFRWLGMDEMSIGKLGLITLKLKEDQPKTEKILNFELKEIPLPDDTRTLKEWAYESDLVYPIIQYVIDRGFDPLDPRFMWSPAAGYSDRVILPFYYNNKIVGFTGRKITEGKPKYLTDSQPGYVFNIDNQGQNKEYVIVVEGQFDAISIDGVAIMTNEPNDIQAARINALGLQVICVPDRDRPGAKMINHALKNHWAVSMPPWEEDIKDVADACKRYGRLYTLTTILHYCETNEIKIQLLKKKLENLHE